MKILIGKIINKSNIHRKTARLSTQSVDYRYIYIYILRQFIEKAIEYKIEYKILVLCFVDLKQAFDTIDLGDLGLCESIISARNT